MKRKLNVVTSALMALMLSVSLYACSAPANETAAADVAIDDTASNTTWREVPIREDKDFVSPSYVEFDLRKIATEADYVFSGTVVSMKDYQVSWEVETGETIKDTNAVIEVKVDHEYHGTSPTDGDTVRVYFPFSLSLAISGSTPIKEHARYVFVTIALDKEAIKMRNVTMPDDKHEQEKYADVALSDSLYKLMPVEDHKVFIYRDFFSYNKDVLEKAVKAESKLLPEGYLKSGVFIALDEKDFKKDFSDLFKDPKSLPNADELEKQRIPVE